MHFIILIYMFDVCAYVYTSWAAIYHDGWPSGWLLLWKQPPSQPNTRITASLINYLIAHVFCTL